MGPNCCSANVYGQWGISATHRWVTVGYTRTFVQFIIFTKLSLSLCLDLELARMDDLLRWAKESDEDLDREMEALKDLSARILRGDSPSPGKRGTRNDAVVGSSGVFTSPRNLSQDSVEVRQASRSFRADRKDTFALDMKFVRVDDLPSASEERCDVSLSSDQYLPKPDARVSISQIAPLAGSSVFALGQSHFPIQTEAFTGEGTSQ